MLQELLDQAEGDAKTPRPPAALDNALETAKPVVAGFIWAPKEEASWAPGGASKWLLHQSLAALNAQLRAAGSRLILRRGPSPETLSALAKETGAKAVFWNRRYEPRVIVRDKRLKEALRGEDLEAESLNAALLHEPLTIRNQGGNPFQVFTPFWRHCLTKPVPAEP